MNKFHFIIGDTKYFCNFKKQRLLVVYSSCKREFFKLDYIAYNKNTFIGGVYNLVFDFNDDDYPLVLKKGWKICSKEKI